MENFKVHFTHIKKSQNACQNWIVAHKCICFSYLHFNILYCRSVRSAQFKKRKKKKLVKSKWIAILSSKCWNIYMYSIFQLSNNLSTTFDLCQAISYTVHHPASPNNPTWLMADLCISSHYSLGTRRNQAEEETLRNTFSKTCQ